MKRLLSLLILSASIYSNTGSAFNTVDVNVNGKIYKAREGYLLVRHKTNGIRLQSSSQVNAMANATVAKRFSYPEGLELVKVQDVSKADASLKIYQASNDILYAEPDFMLKAADLPNDPKFAQQWPLHNVGQTGGTNGVDVNGPQAWQLTKGDHNVVVGTIDTGADYKHPDLAASMWVNTLEIPNNGIDDDGNGFVDDVHGINAIDGSGDPMDDNMHGTHVAGIIAAQQNNGLGVSGIAPNISVAACKFLDASGSGDTAAAITCLNYYRDLSKRSTDPVRIVATNNSWAGGPFQQSLYDAIKVNQDAGILFIAAASNEGQNNDNVETYPANYYLSNIVSVAATDHNDKIADFSNFGRFSVSVAAPGVDILSTVPGGKYAFLSGTSMAAPHVTGLAGLISSFAPRLTWYQIKNLILSGGVGVTGSLSTTFTGRRISAYGDNGTGSLTCADQKVLTRVLPRKSSVTVKAGQALPLAILSIKCESTTRGSSKGVMNPASAFASVSMTGDAGITATAPLILSDNGLGTDQVANDGIFSGTWSSNQKGTYRLRFPGNDIITIKVQ